MKHFMLRSLMLLSLLCSTWGVSSVWAQLTELEVGKVYHFTNVSLTTKAMGATAPNSVRGVDTNNTDNKQLWYVAEKNGSGYYALRNMAYGTYLQANGQSSAWTLATTTASEKTWMQLSTANDKNVFKGYTYGNYGYAHIDEGSKVVGWESGATASQWTITNMNWTSEQINEALEKFDASKYQNHLDNLFSDKSCTTLSGTFDANNASFLALPEVLQKMVRKVAENTSWEENYNNGKPTWEAEYAKKYRVQLYEPYNEPEAAAKALGLNAHTNLNNPTGIFANNGDILYVMVESEIEEGSSLYLTYHIGHAELSGYANGWELHQGLNIIPVFDDETNFCINYVVHTFDTSDGKKGNKAKARKLSDYEPIKIHIEGGYINGYWNKLGDKLYAPDNNDSWEYIEARATQKTVTVLGKYITLQFPLLDENTVTNDGVQRKGLASYFNEQVKIEDCINEWDNVMLWERLLLGIMDAKTIENEAKKSPYSDKATVFEYTGNDGEFGSDYSDYYNVHGLSYGIPNSYMYGGWAHCGYNYGTMDGVIKDLPTSAGAHWGPGHEIGHQHQGLLNMRGLTEVTNNLFANVVLWYFGETTSRYNGDNGALSNVLAQFNAEGTDFFSNNIWSMTIMYYKLFLYYHVLGHNPKFYPHLFEMLRQDPMTIEYNQDGSKCLMHFYKKCCEAAGEDLTEFFRAHGFFEVMDNRFVGDYSNAEYTLTQEQIDAAIAEVKAQAEEKGWKENIAVLFINDATGETIKSHKGDNLEKYGETTICAEMGSYSNFDSEPSNYTYSISGSTVTMEGTGGVGFAILNEKGELIGFSDKKTFEISAEAAAAIASGKASFVTFNGDNSSVAATNIMDAGDNDTKYELLGNLLDDAKALLDLSDETGTKVGYYRKSALTELQTAYTTAKGVYDAKTVAAYSSVYDILFQEYANLVSNAYARINITERYAYRLVNKAYSGRSLAVNTENNQMFGLETAENDAQLWYFEPGTNQNTYYLKNKATSLYPAGASTGTVLSANKDESTKGKDGGAAPYTLQDLGGGVFALYNGPALHCSSSQSYNIVGWGSDADASQWTITAVALDEALEARTKLEELVGKAEALVDEIATYSFGGTKLTLQATNAKEANYLSTNACHNTLNNESDGQGLAGLLDEYTTTFFHSDYRNNVSDPHYLQVDLGENPTLKLFTFNYATRSNGNNCPTAIKVEGSTDGTNFVELKTFTAANDKLPNGEALSWESPVISNNGNYRYLRFTVTEAEGGNKYFVMSTFGISNVTPNIDEIKGSYEVEEATIKSAVEELIGAKQLIKVATAEKSVYDAQFEALDTPYQTLLTAVNAKVSATLDAKRAELQTLINLTTTLIDECGSVTYQPATFNGEAPLQVTDDDGDFYVWTNAQSNQEGPISGLIDGNSTGTTSGTYFHTDYSNADSSDGLDHYINVNLGVQTSDFEFTYTNRPNTESNYATEMTVLGSTDGTNYEEITHLTDLPADKGTTYTKRITADKEYSYLRFMVTMNSSKTQKGGHYFFHMAEFDLTLHGKEESYTAEMKQNIGDVTDDILIAAYKENEEAKSTFKYATTELQVINAIANLQAQYEALEAAKKVVDKEQLIQLIATAKEKLAACGTVTPNGEELDVEFKEETAGSVNKNMLRDLYRAIKTAEGVRDNDNATQEEVNAAINAMTVQIEVIRVAQQNPAKANLKQEIVAMETLLTECTTNPGSASKQLIADCQTALLTAKKVYDADDTTVEGYADAKTVLHQNYYTKLSNAQNSPAKADLNTAITAMESLLDDCEDNSDSDIQELIPDCQTALQTAKNVYDADNTTVEGYSQATTNLTKLYTDLSVAKAKAELRAEISKLEDLIVKCRITGTTIVTTEEDCDLQASSSNAAFYISTNAQTNESGIANLVDEDKDSFFQTKSGVGEAHYLLVDAGADKVFKKFRFSYQTCNNPLPYAIEVYGSDDNADFTKLATFTKDDAQNPLPSSTNQDWTSSEIGNGTAYRYLRFNVTKSGVVLKIDDDKEIITDEGQQLSNKYKNALSATDAATSQSEYCFAMSNFDLTNIVDEEQPTEILAGTVTDTQLTNATFAKNEAQKLVEESTNQADLSAKTVALQEIYEALYAAYGIQVSLATTVESRDKLLSNIEYGKTIGTFSAPYATLIPEDVTAYYAQQEYNGGTVSLTAIEDATALPANQGVILIGEVGVNSVTFYPTTDETPADLSANTFSNSATSSVVMKSNDYILANPNGGEGIGFYQAKEGTTLKQGKAFFRILDPSAPLSFVLRFGGNTTDIDAVTTGTPSDDELIYDIYGRRVTEVKKGNIYIKNGKKFFVK